MGDVREDGCIFWKRGKTYPSGERWVSPEMYHRCRIFAAFENARARSCKADLIFAVTREYLIDIYPKDGLCPVTQVPLVWGTKDGLNNSPSLDRIIPELGYVPNNVIWVSNLVNQIKTDASVAVIGKVYKFYKELTQPHTSNCRT